MATKVDIKTNIESASKLELNGEKSLKSLRTYQVGVVYKDEYGRETPVFTNEDASFTVPKRASSNKNSIVTQVINKSPSWADTFKFFVKETSNEYYNLCMDRWYDAEDDNVWLSFPSAERNKLQEDNFIILKKPSSSNESVKGNSRYKIIDISNEAPDFIKTDYEKYGSHDLVLSGATPGVTEINFEDAQWEASEFYDAILVGNTTANTATPGITDTGFIGWPLESVVIRFSSTTARTSWLDLSNISKVDGDFYKFVLSKALKGEVFNATTGTSASGQITAIIPTGAGTVTVDLAKKVVKNKPEFNGRFFVKIRKDSDIEEHVRSVGNPSPSFNVSNNVQQYFINKNQAAGFSGTYQSYWQSVRENWFIDEAERDAVGTGSGSGTKGPYPEDDGYGILGDTNALTRRDGSADSGLRCTMELSLNKINDPDKGGFDISNNSSTNQEFLKKMTTEGTMFRWKEDPFQIIYKISAGTRSSLDGTQGAGIYNYGSKNAQKKHYANKSVRLYLKFKTTGYRLLNQQASGTTEEYIHEPLDEGLYPFNYQKSYTAPPSSGGNEWTPTQHGYRQYNASSAAASMTTNSTSTAFGDLGDGQTGTTFTVSGAESGGAKTSNTIQIISIGTGDEDPIGSKNPAIWETEPREDVGLDIYYEASQAYPLSLNNKTNELFAPYGSKVTSDDVIQITPGITGTRYKLFIPDNTIISDWAPTGHGGDTLLLNIKTDNIGLQDVNFPLTQTPVFPNIVNPTFSSSSNPNVFQDLNGLLADNNITVKFTRKDGGYTTARVRMFSGYKGSDKFQGLNPLGDVDSVVLLKLDRNVSREKIKIPYFNCYSFGNGVESDRIRDDFNAVRLDKGVKVSTVLDEPYEEEQRANGLIFSGLYNSNSGVNNLNQFIAAEAITKDTNPSYGSIQKLKTRDTNLVAFCEDKILKIVANKDALYNADGKPQLIASNKVLGNVTTFKGEFGISKNPESYAEDSFRMYCTDKQRGKVLRISGDGITPISAIGMEDYFGDNLKENDLLIGSFDDNKQEYNLTLSTQQETLSFSEPAKGWTSFKSFIPEDGLSINNNYYTFKGGELWQHHTNEIRNNFYGDQYDSSVDVVFNEQSESVKSFASMKYEGTQSKITQNVTDGEYYNNENTSTIPGFLGKQGWYVESGITDLQEAGEMEFKSKEGKYFSYMKGKPVTAVEDLDSKEFSFQGIALLESIVDGGGTPILGCTDPLANNYNPNATIDDGSCIIHAPPLDCSTQNIQFLASSNTLGTISVSANLSSDDMPYSISIVGADGFTHNSPIPLGAAGNIPFSGLSYQQYTVTVTSVNGCQATQQITLTPPPPPPPPPAPVGFAITIADLGDVD